MRKNIKQKINTFTSETKASGATSTVPSETIGVTEKYFASYVQSEKKVYNKLTAIYGARVEKVTTDSKSKTISATTSDTGFSYSNKKIIAELNIFYHDRKNARRQNKHCNT